MIVVFFIQVCRHEKSIPLAFALTTVSVNFDAFLFFENELSLHSGFRVSQIHTTLGKLNFPVCPS